MRLPSQKLFPLARRKFQKEFLLMRILNRLGRKFNGGNYFPPESRDFFQKKALHSSLALSFYGAANDNHRELVAAVRKKQLQLKLKKSGAALI